MSAPRCLNCGKPIPRWIESLNFMTREQAARGIGGSDWITVEQLPQTQEEAQRLTNGQITKVYRAPTGMSAEGIHNVNIWKGAYWIRHGHFCKIDCAARFGREMADRGARR